MQGTKSQAQKRAKIILNIKIVKIFHQKILHKKKKSHVEEKLVLNSKKLKSLN